MTSINKRGRPPYDDVLTPAEWRVVEAVRHGMTNSEIAARRGISLDAVKFHVANALQKLSLESRFELRRWNGVRRSSQLSTREVQVSETKLRAIGQIARSVRNVASAKRFYGEVLGLPHLYSFGNLAFFDCGDGVRLFLSEGDGGPSESILYFRVEDVRWTHDQLTRRGVEFTHAPHMIHRHDDGAEEWMAFFKDDEGRPLAIMAQVQSQGASENG